MLKANRGFSLVELSIVLVIIGVLVAMSLSLGSGQVNVANIKSTQAKLDRIDQAIALYLKTNGSLPCPAKGTSAISGIGVAGALTNPVRTITGITKANPAVVTTSTNHGFFNGDHVYIAGVVGMTQVNNLVFTVANKTATTFQLAGIDSSSYGTWTSGGTVSAYTGASCDPAFYDFKVAGTPDSVGAPSSVYIGIVPVRILGLTDDYAIDAWGNRITYAVSQHCVDPTNWSGNNQFKCTDDTGTAAADGGNIKINDLSGGTGTTKLTDAAYAILSLGNDGFGAFNRAGTRAGVAPVAKAKEQNNSSATYAPAVFNEGFINDGTVDANYFDDIVHWKTAARVWDDAYINNTLLPSCTLGQGLISNGGTSYSCGTVGLFQGTVVGPCNTCDKNYTRATTTTATYAVDPTARYLGIQADCVTTVPFSFCTVEVQFENGASILLDASNMIGLTQNFNNQTKITSNNLIPIPQNTLSITIKANLPNPANSPAESADSSIIFYK